MSLPLLEIRNLAVTFGDSKVLHDISFDIPKGSITAVVGESGSGKSVTALTILGLLTGKQVQTSGELIFHQQDGSSLDLLKTEQLTLQKIRGHKIAMIFQEPMTSLNPLMRIGEQVAEVLKTHKKLTYKKSLEETIRLFREVQLPEPETIVHRYPHELSGGQKQRVMIAMAMSCEPDLLIADEPTTALDVTVQKGILELIQNLQRKKNTSVLFITHDLGVVMDIADEVVVLYKGDIVERGPAATVLQMPGHPYTKALLACRPALHTPGSRLPTVADFMEGSTGTLNTPIPEKPLPAGQKLLVEVKDLRVWYPRKKNWLGNPVTYTKALDGISFHLKEGETVGVVGESGCGKSTLGRALLRLVPIHSGTVTVDGLNLYQQTPERIRKLRRNNQLIFQDPYSSLQPKRTTGKSIMEVLQVHGFGKNQQERMDITVDLLEKVGLGSSFLHKYPHQCSGGQRQRIGIARALALQPGFLVCDESVSALDVSVQAQVLNLLNDLKKEYGFTILFISHDLSVVHHISDRILVMHQGTIVETGNADDVFHRPQHPYTQRLLDALPGRRGPVAT